MSIRSLRRWNPVLISLGLIFSLPGKAVGQPAPDPDVAAGWDAYKNYEDARARAAWEKAAKRGVGAAYEGLGLMYLEGVGVEPNAEEARRFFELGAAKKDPASTIRLARMLGRGHGGPEDMDRARELLNEVIIAQRDRDAETAGEAEMALMSLEQERMAEAGGNDAQDAIEEGLKWKESLAADTRPGAAEFREGLEAYELSDYGTAEKAFRRAAERDYAGAFEYLGLIYRLGLGRDPNEEEARRLFAQGAAKGHPASMVLLGQAWLRGEGGATDVAQAKYWFEKAAADPTARVPNRNDAEYELSQLAEHPAAQIPAASPAPAPVAPAVAVNSPPVVKPGQSGAGADDHRKAMELYQAKKVKDAVAFWEKAAGQGHVPAMVELGLTLENGEEDAAPDPKASFTWFQRAAEMNSIEGLLGVGRAYLDGRVVEAAPAKAREHFEKARVLAAGNPNALAAVEAELTVLKGETPENALRVGFAHYQGKTFDEAMKWFRKASDGGNFGGSFNLGLIYERGEGVPVDPAQALAWFEKAKAQGHAKADNAIARVKSRLAGFDEFKKAEAAQAAKQYAEARAWYEKAAAAGNVPAMMKLAELYQRGFAVVKNDRTALSWYEKAAEAGDTFAEMESSMLRETIEMWETNLRMAQLAGAIDGVKSPAAGAKPGPAVPFDSLIKNSPWTVEQLAAAIKSRADAEALAVAIRTDGVVDFHDGDYRRLQAITDGTPIVEFGNLNMAFIEHKKPGAGKWVTELVDAAIAARRVQLKLPPPLVDSPEVRVRASAGDIEALYFLNWMADSDRKLGPLPKEISRNTNELRELVRQAGYRPGFWLIGDEWVYNQDPSQIDLAKAAEYYRQSAEAGDPHGADKLAGAFHDAAQATNYLEVEYWLVESAARSGPGQLSLTSADRELYLLYSSTRPVGQGLEFMARPEDLRWLRELIRRGGPVGEYASLTLDNMRKEKRADIDAMLKALPPEVPPFAAAEVARLEAAAKAGQVDAMLKLAGALASGRGLRQHDKRAVEYYEQAAGKGSAPAMRQLAHHYTSGHGVKKDPVRQLEWTRRLAETSGAPEDWVAYGDRLANTNDKTQTAAMLAAYEKAAAANLPAGFDRLASAYQYGWNGVEKSIPKAIEARLKSAAAGDPKAAGRLARLYVEQADHANAVPWARKAWEGGEREMAIVLARELGALGRKDEATAMYKEAGNEGSEEGQFMYASAMEQVNPAEAYLWHKKLVANPRGGTFKHSSERYIREYDEEQNAPAGSDFAIRKQAKTGDTAAMIEYARRIAAKDRQGAVSWIRWAADKGDTNGMLMLANELFAADKKQAMEWVQKAVDTGSTQAMVLLANQLAATDMKSALEWLQKAEAQGNADAKFQLGGMTYQGRGMTQDQAKGVALMLAAAEAGSLPAQFEMGRAYMQGMPGLAADQSKGLLLLKKASDANVPQAAAVLGEIHERGVGTPQSLAEAHKYYRKAVSLGLTQFKAKADQLESMLMKGMGAPRK